jgi:hypothetical protein
MVKRSAQCSKSGARPPAEGWITPDARGAQTSIKLILRCGSRLHPLSPKRSEVARAVMPKSQEDGKRMKVAATSPTIAVCHSAPGHNTVQRLGTVGLCIPET